MVAVFPYIAVGLLAFALYACRREAAERIVVAVMSLSLVYESVLGMRQLFGEVVSNHSMFPMTGSFSNPGPYGGFIAVCSAVALCFAWRLRTSEKLYERILVWGTAISGLLGLVVLPASMSRTGWIAFLAGVAVPVSAEWKSRHECRMGVVLVAVVIFAALSAGVFMLKRDSALGRFHIWEMECRAIADKPFAGHGAGKALGAFGDAQAQYFETAERSQERIRIAGCPEYVFNEYLRFGLEFGIVGLLLSIGVVAVGTMLLYHGKSALTCGLLALGIFALASYPLAVWQMCVLLSVFIGAAAGLQVTGWKIPLEIVAVISAVCCSVLWFPAEKCRRDAVARWKEEQRCIGYGISEGVADSLALLYPLLRKESRYLYDYGYALYNEGRYEESCVILKEGAERSSDPMFYDIIGKVCERLANYSEAERNYLHAQQMVPSRLYPYILLMEMEDRRGNVEKALGYAGRVLSMPVNGRNAAMCELHERAEKYVQDHESNH